MVDKLIEVKIRINYWSIGRCELLKYQLFLISNRRKPTNKHINLYLSFGERWCRYRLVCLLITQLVSFCASIFCGKNVAAMEISNNNSSRERNYNFQMQMQMEWMNLRANWIWKQQPINSTNRCKNDVCVSADARSFTIRIYPVISISWNGFLWSKLSARMRHDK